MNFKIEPFASEGHPIDWQNYDLGTDVTIYFFGTHLATIRISGAVDHEDVLEYFMSRIFRDAIEDTVKHHGGSVL